MEMNPGKQLFIDDFMMESLTGARRVLNRPEKLTVDEPLSLPLEVWEAGRAQVGSVVYDEANHSFRMYYRVWPEGRCLVGALDSADGVHWERLRLGLVEHNGSTDNNFVNIPYGSILWDPHERDETYRWKMFEHIPTGVGPDGEKLLQAFYSRDGYAWYPYPRGPHNVQKQLVAFGSPAETFGGPIDPEAPYIMYTQRGSSRRTRVLGRRDSQDYRNWSGLHTVIDQDLQDTPGAEFYGGASDPANRTVGGLHIMVLHTFLTDLTEPYLIADADSYWGAGGGPRAMPARIDGFVEPQLAVSRNTVTWTRYREPFIHRGRPGAFDWGQLYAGAPILHDGKLWFFYMGCSLTHNGRSPQLWKKAYPTQKTWAAGVAQLRPDGYVSVEAESYAPGILTTHRFRQQSGGTVQVNVDASAGELRYALLEDTGQVIPGYSASECDPIRSDTMEGQLSWRGVPGWPGVSEERQGRYPNLQKQEFYVKLVFYIYPGTKLYSLTLDPPEVTMWQVKISGRID